jgi:hypothetical protein
VELKQLITHFTYRIEPKPEGGFIAHASDPTVAPLEAPTRQELQQKIQATIVANLGAQFPTLKSAIEGQTSNFAFHIERKPGGGFILHSGQDEPIEVGTHDDLEAMSPRSSSTLWESTSHPSWRKRLQRKALPEISR